MSFLPSLVNNPSIETTGDVKAVLNETKRIAVKVVSDYESDIPLQLSFKAFDSALDNFINCLN